jgi:hypothetical protein
MTDTIVGWTLAALAVLWLLYGILVVGGGYHGRLPWDRKPRSTYRDEVLRDSPIGYWPLDGDLEDHSGDDHDVR